MDIRHWRLLLVDDDEDDYVLMRDMLRQLALFRCQVDWARSAPEGRDALRSNVYDAVLVDYYLGEETGMDVLRYAVEVDYPAPFVMLTGQGRPDLDLQALQAGAADYLNKQEVSPALLERSIRFALERKQNERSLKAANARLAEELEERKHIEGRLRRLLETSYEGIVILDNWAVVQYINPRGAQILGYQVDEVTDRSSFDFLFSPEDVQATVEILAQIGGGFSGYIETHARHKNGEEVILLVSTGPVQEENGQFVGALGMFTDVTERRRAESHAHFLAELGNHLIEDRDPREISELVSARLAEHLGAERCHINEGESVFSPRLPQGQVLVVENTATDPRTAGMTLAGPLFRAGSFILIPHRLDERPVAGLLVVRDHPSRWYKDDVDLLLSAAHLAWLALDHARSTRRLREAEERFRVALSNTQITVFTMDRDLRYTWVYNPPPAIQAETMVGRRNEDLVPPSIAALLQAPKRQVIETGRSLSCEIAIPRVEGTLYYSLSLEPTFDPDCEDGGATGLIAAAIDTTHLRSLEAQQIENKTRAEVLRLLNQQRELERLELSRDLHDGPLQEIMAASIGLGDAMTIADPGTHHEKLNWVREILQRQAAEMRIFCQDLRPPTLASFGLEKAIRSHLLSFQQRHPGIRFRVDLMPDNRTLPEETRLAFFRIYQEALNNLVRHTHATEARVTLWVGANEVILEIRDNGEGFQVPVDWLVQARTSHYGLLGMRERAAAVNATLELSSTPGSGTVVRVSVPV